jgi:hypothetical protein
LCNRLSWYLNINKDIRESNFNPLVHYLLFGKNEGRLGHPRTTTESSYNIDEGNSPFQNKPNGFTQIDNNKSYNLGKDLLISEMLPDDAEKTIDEIMEKIRIEIAKNNDIQ